jgi:hypothetical protein
VKQDVWTGLARTSPSSLKMSKVIRCVADDDGLGWPIADIALNAIK